MDRTKRYANPPKGKKMTAPDKDETGAEGKVEATAGSPPQMKDAPKVGKMGEDPGPSGGKDATWGVVASRHAANITGMLKRHGEEAASMHERHSKEMKDMHKSHMKEAEEHFMGGHENEGEKGSEP